MAGKLNGLPVAFLTAIEGTEQIELIQPWEAVKGEGGQPSLISQQPGDATLFQHLDRGDTWPVDVTLDQARPTDYAALVLPGGVVNADFLRMDKRAVEFARSLVESGRPVGVICHGPWTLIEAGVLRGRTITSFPSLRTDIVNAGGRWVDEQVVIDDNGPNVIISSRGPKDLPAFCDAIVEQFSRQTAGAR